MIIYQDGEMYVIPKKWLGEHDKHIRAEVLDELKGKIDDEYLDGNYGDYHEVEMIVRMIKELKEQNK